MIGALRGTGILFVFPAMFGLRGEEIETSGGFKLPSRAHHGSRCESNSTESHEKVAQVGDLRVHLRMGSASPSGIVAHTGGRRPIRVVRSLPDIWRFHLPFKLAQRNAWLTPASHRLGGQRGI